MLEVVMNFFILGLVCLAVCATAADQWRAEELRKKWGEDVSALPANHVSLFWAEPFLTVGVLGNCNLWPFGACALPDHAGCPI